MGLRHSSFKLYVLDTLSLGPGFNGPLPINALTANNADSTPEQSNDLHADPVPSPDQGLNGGDITKSVPEPVPKTEEPLEIVLSDTNNDKRLEGEGEINQLKRKKNIAEEEPPSKRRKRMKWDFGNATHNKSYIPIDIDDYLSLFIRKNVEVEFNGLQNPGNYCYMNTVLQCLRSLSPFRDFFTNSNLLTNDDNKSSLLHQTAIVMKAITSPPWRAHDPRALIHTLKQLDPMYGLDLQQDCMEFFLFFINAVCDECALNIEPKSSSNFNDDAESHMRSLRSCSILKQMFFHLMVIEKTCNTCATTVCSYETDSTIILSVPERDCSLNELQQEYFEDYEIEGYVCSNCKNPLKNKKMLQMESPILVIFLKRYFRSASSTLLKNTFNVKFELEEMKLKTRSGTTSYKLESLVFHIGNLDRGHYTAGCRTRGPNEWVEVSDSQICELDGSKAQSRVCAFFYCKVPII